MNLFYSFIQLIMQAGRLIKKNFTPQPRLAFATALASRCLAEAMLSRQSYLHETKNLHIVLNKLFIYKSQEGLTCNRSFSTFQKETEL